MKLHAIVPLIILSAILTVNAQIPVTVNRSTIRSGGTIILPGISGGGRTDVNQAAPGGSASPVTGWCAGTTGTDGWNSVTGTATGSGTLDFAMQSLFWVVSGTPIVTISTNAPPLFTNSCTAIVRFAITRPGMGAMTTDAGYGQQYVVTIVEDGSGGGGSIVHTGTLTGMGDTLQSLSRRDASSDHRKLLGFQLKATTNAVVTSLAVSLSNTTTNPPPDNNFPGIKLYQDDGTGEWETADTELAATTNATGYAIFNGLSVPLNTTNKTFFVAASFCPTNQTRNSFISGSLKSQNIIVTLAGTNTVIETTGGTVVGKQYGFLDTTQAEDDAAASALASQINTAVDGATNALNSAWSQQLSTTTDNLNAAWGQQLNNATNGWSRTGSNSSSKTSFTDTILPAAAAGAAGIGAAFTSDQLTNQPLSNEYTKPK
jgi:hypothetical protein